MQTMGGKKGVIFDLDGTLADGSHREHLIKRPVGERKWDEYFALCDKDILIRPIAELLWSMYDCHYPIHILTGRCDSTRDKTLEWLDENGIPHSSLRMRPVSDRTDDHILKPSWAAELGGPARILFVVEDRNRVVRAWRALGYKVLQPAEGDF